MINLWNEAWVVHLGKHVVLQVRANFLFKQRVKLKGRHVSSSQKVIISNKSLLVGKIWVILTWDKQQWECLRWVSDAENGRRRQWWNLLSSQKVQGTRYVVLVSHAYCCIPSAFLPNPLLRCCLEEHLWDQPPPKYMIWSWKPRWHLDRENISWEHVLLVNVAN